MEISSLAEKIKEKNGLKLGIAADHGGFELKKFLLKNLKDAGYEITDFGDLVLKPDDDYPDYVFPLAGAIATGKILRGIAVCGSGVGACIAANKTPGVRACLIHEKFSAHQGVEDDDMNMICLGGRVVDHKLAWDLVTIFLNAKFVSAERHVRRLQKIQAFESRLNEWG
jgi:ribose 5-phosphate isomerase B